MYTWCAYITHFKFLIMIYKFLVLVCLLGTLISCKGYDSQDNKVIADSNVPKKVSNQPEIWRWKSEDSSQEFTIKILRITKDSLLAQYCGVYNNGQKLDCDFEENINIKAAFDKNKNAYVGSFHSFFNSGNGTCLIKLTDGDLRWEILKNPAGEYYAPDKCFLKKEKIESAKITSDMSETTTVSTTIFPLDIKNFTKKIKFESPTDDNIQNLFRKKYQLGIDAIAKLPSNENFDLYIVVNVSGDSELVYLITMKDGKLIADLEIGDSNGDSDEIKVFSITEKYEVLIYSEKNGKRKLIETFLLINNGNFVEQRIL